MSSNPARYGFFSHDVTEYKINLNSSDPGDWTLTVTDTCFMDSIDQEVSGKEGWADKQRELPC